MASLAKGSLLTGIDLSCTATGLLTLSLINICLSLFGIIFLLLFLKRVVVLFAISKFDAFLLSLLTDVLVLFGLAFGFELTGILERI